MKTSRPSVKKALVVTEPESLSPESNRESSRPEAIDQEKLAALPASPGCYLFYGRKGELLYIGKAKNLRARVRSYFQEGSRDLRAFIPWLRRAAVELSTVVTATEKEAAILENSLIKEHRPKYNVKLRDDKEYLSLRLDPEARFPRLELVRRPKADQARYFGPYPSATGARRTMKLVDRHFQLRTCSDRELYSRKRPCVQYQIKRCPAPCVFEVDEDSYAAQVKAVGLFLDGRHDDVTILLGERMQAASRALDFELAAVLRDQIEAVRRVQEQQRVVSVKDRDLDVLGLHREEDLAELVLLRVRGGRLVDVEPLGSVQAQVDDGELVATFLREQYGGGPKMGRGADEILVPCLPEGADGIAEWIGERQSLEGHRRSVLVCPQRGPRRQLLELARENAQHAFAQAKKERGDMDAKLIRLMQRLRLSKVPHRIECVDISHLGGTDTVGAVVRVTDGVPDKGHYRTYRVRTTGGGDDYGALYEVLSRRFLRGRGGEQGGASTEWELPDLLVVDGGRGQLKIAMTAAEDLGITDLMLVALAKEKESPTGEQLVDRVYLPNQKNPIQFRSARDELHLLALARDEAHRFANRGREKVGRWRLRSYLDGIAGVGPKTRVALLRSFPSLEAIASAPDEAILQVPGVSQRVLTALRKALSSTDNSVVDGEGADN